MSVEPSVSPTVEALRTRLLEQLAECLGLEARSIDPHERFSRYGLTSLLAARLLAGLATSLGRPLAPTLVWDHPTVDALARHLAGEPSAPTSRPRRAEAPRPQDEPIAVVGLACRFPKASGVRAYWRLLCDGVDAITEVPQERWDLGSLYDEDPAAPGKVRTRWGGFLEQVDRFDAQFFGISPREAVQMDPQQRLMMELAWEALEDSGQAPRELKGSRTGVFFGAMWSDYTKVPGNDLAATTQHTATGQDLSIIPARVSYTLGLQGPSLAVNTACSSSLVAIHLACQSLRRGESSLALAGGVNLMLSPASTVAMSKFGAMAPDGRSKAFDARANGYVRGEGAGVVVLKPLSRALAEGDPIYCVIRGSAVNNDGFSNGLTAPNPQAQEDVLRDAYANAGVEPARVRFVEAHGTGTMLGDPIEAKALGTVLGEGRPAERPLRLGSVKTNIGHLETAAGIAGFIKVALSLRHRTLPPNLHFQKPNPHIPFEALKLEVQTALTHWPDEEVPRVAGVSSFGFGGTNCHVVLQEAPASPAHLFALSAGSEQELRALARAVETRASGSGVDGVETLCKTAAVNVDGGVHRLAATVRSRAELVEQLRAFTEGQSRPGLSHGQTPAERRGRVFVFSGQGSQWLGMGRELMTSEPVFRDALVACERAMRPFVDFSLLDVLNAGPEKSWVEETEIVQPAIFAIQVATAALWRSWGVEPEAVVGQSMGEVAAAHVAGCLELEDAARVICLRSQLVKRRAPKGSMAVVELSLEDAQRALGGYEDRLAVAVSSSPTSSVLSGDPSAMDEVLTWLDARGVFCRRIKVDYASHSPQMEGLRKELRGMLEGIRPWRATVPFYSTVTATRLESAEVDPEYWVRNLRDSVLFSQTVTRLLKDGYSTFLMMDPHPVLANALEQGLAHHGKTGEVLASLRRDEDGRAVLLDSLGKLFTLGHDVDWLWLYPDGPWPRSVALEDGRPEVLTLSAHRSEALVDLARETAAWMTGPHGYRLKDLCYTLDVRRGHLEHRLAVVGRSRKEIHDELEAFVRGENPLGVSSAVKPPDRPPRVAFVFPGQGGQWKGMAKRLLAEERVFRQTVEACEVAMWPYVSWSLVDVLKGEAGDELWDRIDFVQPALFAVGVGLTALWRSWGVEPDAVVGHSMGEVAAAYVAGVLSLEDAARVICVRSQLMRRLSGKGGAMGVVELTADEARQELKGYEDKLAVAVSNSRRSTVLSGDGQALEEVLGRLERRGVFTRRVKVDVASHSPQVEGLRQPLLAELKALKPGKGKVPLYSTVKGAVTTGEEMGAAYWVDNLRQPVLFHQSVKQVVEAGCTVLVEMGPHPVLLPSVEETLKECGVVGAAVASMRREEDEGVVAREGLGTVYAHGYEVQWERLYPSGQCVRLPTYPFQRERYWFEEPTGGTHRASTSGHPLLGAHQQLALKPGSHLWETELGTDLLPYLEDHRVLGSPVLPAAAYVEMALAAAVEAFGGMPRLEGVRLLQAISLGDKQTQAVQLSFTPESSGTASFQLFSRPVSEARGAWTLNATGTISTGPRDEASPAREPVEGIQARCSVMLLADEHYRVMREGGLEYGPAFQGVRKLWRREGEALARMELPQVLASKVGAYQLHPALLDACFQVLYAARANAEPRDTYLPVRVKEVRVLARPGQRLWSHARLAPSAQPGAASFEGDVRLLDEEGRVLVEVLGLQAQRMETRTERGTQDELSGWLHELQWQPEVRSAQAPTQSQRGTWLLFADGSGVAQALATELKARGEECVLVSQDRVDPTQPEPFRQLLKESLGAGRPPCRGVVYLWSLDIPAQTTGAALERSHRLGTGGVLHLVQALAQAGWRDAPRLWMVTRGAQPVGVSSPLAVAQAPLWGMAKVIAHEHPDLRPSMVDLDPSGSASEIPSLVEELWADGREDQLALRGEQRLVARLVKAPSRTAEDAERRIPAGDQPFRLDVSKPGVLDSMKLRPATRRAPGAGEVELHVHSVGINFLDVLTAMGIRPDRKPEDPLQLGGECSGTITAVGPGVEGLQVGQDVVAASFGCFGSHVTVPADFVAPKPAHLDFSQAASVPLVFMTVHYALNHLGRIRKGERILIHSATGGTGLAAIQIARAAGAEIFATAGSPEKRELLRSMGIQHVMDSRTLDFAGEILARTGGRGVDLVLNSLSGEAIPRSMEVLAPYGRFLEMGKRDIYENVPLGLSPFRKSLSYFAIDLAGMAVDRPDLFSTLLREVMEQLVSGTLQPLPVRVFPASEADAAFRLMAQAKHTGKLAVCLRDERAVLSVPASAAAIHPEATYLITGGLGGLGLAVARWLVSQGARHLALVGRRAPDAQARAAVAELESAGARVLVESADVAHEEQVARVLARVEQAGPPLRGIVHAAGILEDGLLPKLDRERFARVLAPKVAGSWNLHARTLGRPLDFFVLFSSATSVIGSPGQANYAAGNAFLDALAHHRHALGLPALSINWGPWAEVGLAAAQENRGERLAFRGLGSLSVAQGIEALGRLMREARVQAGVMPLNVRQWRQSYPRAAATPFLSLLAREESGTAPAAGGSLRESLLAAEPTARSAMLEAWLREQVARVLRLPPARVEPRTPLPTLGMDSLMGLELRNRLESGLGVTLPGTLLWTYPTVSAIATHLAGKLGVSLEAAAPATDPEPTHVPLEVAPPAEDALASTAAQIEQLSDEEMERLLLEKLNNL